MLWSQFLSQPFESHQVLGRLMENGGKNLLYSVLSMMYQVEVSLVWIYMLGRVEIVSDTDVFSFFFEHLALTKVRFI